MLTWWLSIVGKITMWEHVSKFPYFLFIFSVIASLCGPKWNRADLNYDPCRSESFSVRLQNRRNRGVFTGVHVCLFLFGFQIVQLCGSELAFMWLLIAFCADLAILLCGQLYVKFQFWGLFSPPFDVSCLFQAVK